MKSTILKNQKNNISRKIYIYEICCIKDSSEEVEKFEHTEQLFKEMDNIKGVLEYNNTVESRWHSVESIVFNGDFCDCTLICCKYNYMPNLIDIKNRSERNSPKSISEGDKEKTHITIKDNIIAYEQRRNGTSATVLSRLMNIAWKNIRNNLDHQIKSIALRQVIDKSFLDTIKKASKIKQAEFLVTSTVLGTDFFNFGNDSEVEDLYTLKIKAKRKKSINKANFIDKIERYLAGEERIEKITASIYDEDNNPRLINTEEFSKQYNISVSKNANGEVIDSDIFEKLKGLI